MSLLAVPRRPETCQVSSIAKSERGTSRRIGKGYSGTNAPSSAHDACRQPLEYCQWPDSRQPPSAGSIRAPDGLKAEHDHTSPSAKNSSWASSEASPTCHVCTPATENTHPVEAHADDSRHETSKNVS